MFQNNLRTKLLLLCTFFLKDYYSCYCYQTICDIIYLSSITETRVNQELLVQGKVVEELSADLEVIKEKGN